MVQGLRAVVAIPLYAVAHANADGSQKAEGRLLGGVVSRFAAHHRVLQCRPADQDALSAQAASILDNARLVEKEREQRRLEQELAIAREIQQGLVPQGLREFPYLEIKGIHLPCHGVGGDSTMCSHSVTIRPPSSCRRDPQGAWRGAAHDHAARRVERHATWRRSRESLQPREPLPLRASIRGTLSRPCFSAASMRRVSQSTCMGGIRRRC